MSNYYDSPIISIKICGHPFNVHEDVINRWMVTGDINKEFTSIHEYNTTPELGHRQANELIDYMYTGSNTKIPEIIDNMETYIFVDKYFKDDSIRELFTCRKKIINSFNTLKDYLIFGELPKDTPNERHDHLGVIIVAYIRKICKTTSNANYWAKDATKDGTRQSTKERRVVIGIMSIDSILESYLEIAYNNGLNIWDTWKEEMKTNDVELLHCGIDIKDPTLPRKYDSAANK